MIVINAMLVLAIAALAVLGLSYGDQPIPVADVIGALTGDTSVSPQSMIIVMELRLPRILLGLLIGLALGVAGAITQAVMRNPLAEPGLLGINSGAALGATLLMVGMGGAMDTLVPAAAFVGAAAMAVAIYVLSWKHGTSSLRIILIGIGLGALGNAATTFMAALGDIRHVQRTMVWLAGTIYDSNWAAVETMLLWSAAPLAVAWLAARELDTIAFGDLTARSLGQPVNWIRTAMLAICTLLSAAAVSASGLIGFVGLIAPHMARRLVGHAHARLIPTAALLGAVMVMSADFAGRTLIAPAQLPAGLMTALVGAPFFAWLMWERRHAAV